MRVAIPKWGEQVSPVLDAARTLLVVDSGAAGVNGRDEVALDGGCQAERAAVIVGLHVDVVICGALSRGLEERLTDSGITVVSWIVGCVEDVLAAYERGELPEDRFRMPGRSERRRCRRRLGRERDEKAGW